MLKQMITTTEYVCQTTFKSTKKADEKVVSAKLKTKTKKLLVQIVLYESSKT